MLRGSSQTPQRGVQELSTYIIDGPGRREPWPRFPSLMMIGASDTSSMLSFVGRAMMWCSRRMGREASISFARNTPCHCARSDNAGDGGLTVLHHIRNGNRDQPVIMFTGVWTPKTEQQVRALGVTEIAQKDPR